MSLAAVRPARHARMRIAPSLLQLAFVAAHAVLFVMIPKHSALATWHGRLTLLVGLVVAVFARPQRAAYVVAYVIGAEVFWRMRQAEVPWEFAKFLTVVILGVALLRLGRLRRPLAPILYFVLLLPSAALTVFELKGTEVRSALSFNLSGPLALAVGVLFFSSIALTSRQMQWLFISGLAPIVGIAVVGYVNVRAFAPIEFSGGSNVAASGGFGPNQVSAILGFGILLCVLYLAIGTVNIVVASVVVGIVMLLAAQCALTFSRGGLYMAAGGTLAAAFYLVRDARTRWKVLLGGAAVVVLLMTFVMPRLESLTSGSFAERLRNTDPTGRELLAGADLKTWFENPFLGSGPGLGGANRARAFRIAAAHTEYTRLLAEHGLPGLTAIGLLLAIVVRNLRRRSTPRGHAVCAAMAAYSLLFMSVEGMRLALPSFAFGHSCVTLAIPKRRESLAPAPRALAATAVGGRA